jgi:small-conductance mechanosensitive channel
MPFFDQLILLNSVRAWLTATTIAIVLIVAFMLFKRILILRLQRLASRTTTDFDDLFVHLAKRIRTGLAFALAIYVSTIALSFGEEVEAWIGAIAFAIFLIQVTIWGNTLLDYWLARQESEIATEPGVEATNVNVVAFLGRILFYAIIILLVLDNIPGVEVTALIASLGIGGIAVALAVQNILGDLFASLSIALDKPFVVGDTISVGEFTGTVENVGLKTTRIRSITGEQIVFSNNDLLTSRIRNFQRLEQRRIVFNLSVDYNTPVETLREIPALVERAISVHEQVQFERVHLRELAESSIIYECVYFVEVSDFTLYLNSQQEIYLTLLEAFEKQGIGLAFPTQTILMQQTAKNPALPAAGNSVES